MGERDLTLMPDGREIYFSAQVGPGVQFSAIVVVRWLDGEWSEPEVASFSGRHLDIEPAISPDGKKLFFMSDRPQPGKSDSERENDIWVVEREGESWGEPSNIDPPVNSEQPEYFPSVTPSIVPGPTEMATASPSASATGNEWSASLSPDGNALFFMASRSLIVDHRPPEPMSYAEMRRLHDRAMNGNADLWWVDAGLIEALRPAGF
jgi:hypothetical protein